jgi:hypothetical protein
MTSRTSRATRVPGARHWPLAALLLASVLWGGAITGTKYALRAFDPITLLSVELAARGRRAVGSAADPGLPAAAVLACLAGLIVLTGGAAAARPPATSASSAACSAPASRASWRSASPTTATHYR